MTGSTNLGVYVTIKSGGVTPAVKQAVARTGRYGRELTRTWERTHKKIAATGAILKYNTMLERLQRRQKAASGENVALAAKIDRLKRNIAGATERGRSYGLAMEDVAGTHRKLQAELDRTGQRMRTIDRIARSSRASSGATAASRFTASRAGLVGTALAAAGLGRGLHRTASRDEEAAYLRSVVNADDKDAAVARAVARARAFARAPGSVATDTEIVKLQYQLNSAGLEARAAEAGAEVAHKLARVTRGGSESVAGIVGTVMNTFGARMEGDAGAVLDRVGNVLAHTQIKYKFENFEQLGSGLAEAAAAASVARVPLEDTVAALGALNNAGTEGSRAGTALQAMLRGLGKEFEGVRFEAVRGADGMLKLDETVARLDAQLDRIGDIDERARVLRGLFGDEGLVGIDPLLSLGGGELGAGIDAAGEAGRSDLVDEEYGRLSDTSAARLRMMGQNLVMVGDALARVVLPGAVAVAGALAGVSGWLAAAIESSWWLRAAIGTVSAGVAAGAAGWAMYKAWVMAAAGAQWLKTKADIAGEIIQRIRTLGLRGSIAALRVWIAQTKLATVAQRMFNFVAGLNPYLRIAMIAIAAIGLIGAIWGKTIGKMLMKFEPVQKVVDGALRVWRRLTGGEAVPDVGEGVPPVGAADAAAPPARAGPAAALAAGGALAMGAAVVPDVGGFVPPVGAAVVPDVGEGVPPVGGALAMGAAVVPDVGGFVPPVGAAVVPDVGEGVPPVGGALAMGAAVVPDVGGFVPPVGAAAPDAENAWDAAWPDVSAVPVLAPPDAAPEVSNVHYGGPITVRIGPITVVAPPEADVDAWIDRLAERLRGDIEDDVAEALRRAFDEAGYREFD